MKVLDEECGNDDTAKKWQRKNTAAHLNPTY